MLKRVQYCSTVFFLLTLVYITRIVLSEIFENGSSEVDEWLEQNELGDYKKLFKELGTYLFNNINNKHNETFNSIKYVKFYIKCVLYFLNIKSSKQVRFDLMFLFLFEFYF